MIGVYFSGTGNSKYILEVFLKSCQEKAVALAGEDKSRIGKWESVMTFSIENEEAVSAIKAASELVISYPVQYSNIPKILVDFVVSHQEIWAGKKVYVIATMGLFSGDGAGMLARLLQKYGAVILGGLHVKMPDSIGDEKALKRPLEVNRQLVRDAKMKTKQAAEQFVDGRPLQEGLSFRSHLAGLFGQRLYFRNKTRNYTDKLKIDADKCIGCGKCEQLCPMKNIIMNNKTAAAGDKCTMCYRCVNHCPKQAITLLGKRVVEQSIIEKYL